MRAGRAPALFLSAILVALSGCSQLFDVNFANPCSTVLIIQTYSTSKPSPNNHHKTAILPPRVTTLVEEAFSGPIAIGWSVRINGVKDLFLKESDFQQDTIVIPAEICARRAADDPQAVGRTSASDGT